MELLSVFATTAQQSRATPEELTNEGRCVLYNCRCCYYRADAHFGASFMTLYLCIRPQAQLNPPPPPIFCVVKKHRKKLKFSTMIAT